jgi:hypothetical protein
MPSSTPRRSSTVGARSYPAVWQGIRTPGCTAPGYRISSGMRREGS